MPPGELPTLGEVLHQYRTATLHDAMELSQHTGLPLDECVQYALPFQARVAAATLDLLSFSHALGSAQAKEELLPPSPAE